MTIIMIYFTALKMRRGGIEDDEEKTKKKKEEEEEIRRKRRVEEEEEARMRTSTTTTTGSNAVVVGTTHILPEGFLIEPHGPDCMDQTHDSYSAFFESKIAYLRHCKYFFLLLHFL